MNSVILSLVPNFNEVLMSEFWYGSALQPTLGKCEPESLLSIKRLTWTIRFALTILLIDNSSDNLKKQSIFNLQQENTCSNQSIAK